MRGKFQRPAVVRDATSKWCPTCGNMVLLVNFGKNKVGKDGLDYRCKACHRECGRIFYEKIKLDPARLAKRRERAHYLALKRNGIKVEEYLAAVADQNGVCAICHNPPRLGQKLYADHDHKTGQFRGALCIGCNIGIGVFYDNPDLFRRASEYIEFHLARSI